VIALHHRPDGTDVTFHDANVTRVSLTDRLTLDVRDRDGDALRVVLLAPLEVTHGSGETWSLRPGDGDDKLARLAFALRDTWLLTCGTDARGTRSMVFEAGVTIRVAPDPLAEAWSLLNDRFRLAGVAGVELADATHE
jgi:hypothetical protein